MPRIGTFELDTDKPAVSLHGKLAVAGDTPVEMTAFGYMRVDVASIAGGGPSPPDQWDADGLVDSIKGQMVIAGEHLFNETTWDRRRANTEIVLMASAARTALTNSSDVINYNGKGLVLIVNVTLDGAAAAITPTIDAKDPISGAYKEIWKAGAAIEAVGTLVYILYPGNTDGGDLTGKDTVVIPRTWRCQMEVADADSMTYSVAASLIL